MNGFGIRDRKLCVISKRVIFTLKIQYVFQYFLQTRFKLGFFFSFSFTYIFPCDFGTLLVSTITCIFDIYTKNIYVNVILSYSRFRKSDARIIFEIFRRNQSGNKYVSNKNTWKKSYQFLRHLPSFDIAILSLCSKIFLLQR